MTENTATSTEDLAVALREGRPIRDHGPYLVRIGDERLEFPDAIDVQGARLLLASEELLLLWPSCSALSWW